MVPFLGPDPRTILGALIRQMVRDGHSAFGQLVDRYILNPENAMGGGPLMQDPAVVSLYKAVAAVAMALLVVILAYSSLRSMFEHNSIRAKYTLKLVLPKVMLVTALVPLGLPLVGGAMSLNSAVAHTVWSTSAPDPKPCLSDGELNPKRDVVWCGFMDNFDSSNIIMGLLFLLLTVLLVILALVGIVRNVVIAVVAITAPLAFLSLLLPETHSYANYWRRILFTAIFAQSLQVAILRLSLFLTFRDDAVAVVHGLVAMYLVLKVPSALHSASSAESKVMMYARHAEHGVQMAVHHALHPPHRRSAVHPAEEAA